MKCLPNWQPGDAPEAHPYFAAEVELERRMMVRGAEKVADLVLKAKEKGRMATTKPGKALIEDWVPEVALGLHEFVRDTNRRRGGPVSVGLKYLRQVPLEVAALVGCRVTVQRLISGRRATAQRPEAGPCSVTQTLFAIGRSLEHEAKVRAWEKQDKESWKANLADLKVSKATSGHRARVSLHIANARIEEGQIEFQPWPEQDLPFVGQIILDQIIMRTGWVEIIDDPEFVYRGGRKMMASKVMVPRSGLLEWMARAMDHWQLSSAEHWPTVCPPRAWTDTKDGGYHTPYANSPRLIRFKAHQEHQRRGALDEYDALDIQRQLDGVNFLQSTAYRINTRVLEVVTDAWALDQGIGGLPVLTDKPLPPRTGRIAEVWARRQDAKAAGLPVPPDPQDETYLKELKKWKAEASKVYGENALRFSHSEAARATVRLAEDLRDYPAIYFPHMLDFRGRKYPVPNFLQPQGNDLARGLLTYATAYSITKANGGVRWLAILVASLLGKVDGVDLDKQGFETRIAWVEEHEAILRAIAKDPLGNYQHWKKADKPWQFLAACFEWVSYLEHGDGYLASLPGQVDGTCNGIQHLAAMLRDKVTGAYVNLVPGEKPRDIYAFVAGLVQKELETVYFSGLELGFKANEEAADPFTCAGFWLALCGGDLPRTLTKRQVMVLPYGGSREAFFKYTRIWVKKEHPEVFENEGRRPFINKAIGYFVDHLWRVVKENIKGAVKVMEWIQKCAKAAMAGDQPIYWITPDGFVVRHFYGKEESKQVHLRIDGTRLDINVPWYTKELDKKAQLQGIAPNFVHSLDAATLTITMEKARAAGLTAFTAVHDCFGTHLGRMDELAAMLRDAFVEVHEANPLATFRQACHSVMVAYRVSLGEDMLEAAEKADTLLPSLDELELGDLDLSQVRQSPYFFA
jgi:DNA-directed RNA polymerase